MSVPGQFDDMRRGGFVEWEATGGIALLAVGGAFLHRVC